MDIVILIMLFYISFTCIRNRSKLQELERQLESTQAKQLEALQQLEHTQARHIEALHQLGFSASEA